SIRAGLRRRWRRLRRRRSRRRRRRRRRPEVLDHARHKAVRTPVAVEIEAGRTIFVRAAELQVRDVEEAVLQTNVDIRADCITDAQNALPGNSALAVGEFHYTFGC